MEHTMTAEIAAVLEAMGEGEVRSGVTDLSAMQAHLRATNLFVPGVIDPRELAPILEKIAIGPVFCALTGGGTLPAGGHAIPIPGIVPDSLPVVNATLTLTDAMFDDERFVAIALAEIDARALRKEVVPGETRVGGLAFMLPPWLVRVQAAFEAAFVNPQYRWDDFFAAYRQDLAAAMAQIVDDRVLHTPRMALQAHAGFDPRVGPDEVGLSMADACRYRVMGGAVADILGRWPSTGKRSFRFASVVILPDQEDGMLYLNPGTWQEDHGGDFDGDLGYVMVEHPIRREGDVERGPLFDGAEIKRGENGATD